MRAVCTTDDPADPLDHHAAIAASGLTTQVYPTFRPDRALEVDDPATFNPWVERLGADGGHRDRHVRRLRARAAAAAPGLPRRRRAPVRPRPGLLLRGGHAPTDEAAAIFDRARAGQAATPAEHEQFASYLMLLFGRLDAEKGWTKQLHLGARRNVNTRMLRTLGRDTGFDSIGDCRRSRRSPGTSIGSSRKARCRRPSSTTTTRPTTTRWPR